MVSHNNSRNEDESCTNPYAPGTDSIAMFADWPGCKVNFVRNDTRHKDRQSQDSEEHSEDKESCCKESRNLKLELLPK
jgi:hypothetical protein